MENSTNNTIDKQAVDDLIKIWSTKRITRDLLTPDATRCFVMGCLCNLSARLKEDEAIAIIDSDQ